INNSQCRRNIMQTICILMREIGLLLCPGSHPILPYTRLSYFSFHGLLGVCDYSFEPAFIRHARLRKHLPQELEDKRLSKVETLRVAIYYINVEPAGLVSGWRWDGGPTKPLRDHLNGKPIISDLRQ
uniref:BHLH domain-containing protein n=1 Tax=Sparus aurata TaxID=8175 RepID=A0A671UBL8_SPAAU